MQVVKRQLNRARPIGGRGTCEGGYLLADENQWRRGGTCEGGLSTSKRRLREGRGRVNERMYQQTKTVGGGWLVYQQAKVNGGFCWREGVHKRKLKWIPQC